MVDISKASRVLDRDMRFREGDPQVQAERERIIEALRHGNIHEVFAKETKFKVGDFSDFFSNQWKGFKSQIIQDIEIKAGEASCPPPDLSGFPVHHQGTTVTPEEGDLFSQSMGDFLMTGTAGGAGVGGGKFKAQGVDGTAPPVDPMGEVAAASQGTLGEWDQFQEDMWGTIFDAQLSQEMQRKMGEVRSEVQRIIALAREGKIGVEFVLIALAKVNSTKNGVLMSGLGKKMYKINEDLNKTSEDLYSMSVTDPQYYGVMTLAKEETRQGAFDLSMLTQDMQKTMQNVQSTMEFVHSSLGQINRFRTDVIRKFSASG